MTPRPRLSMAAATPRPETAQRDVPVRDLEVLDALLDLIDDDGEAEAGFIAWLTGDVDVRAVGLAEAMIARAGRR